MIRNCFLVLNGIGEQTQNRIRHSGIRSWNDFLNADKIKGISASRKLFYNRELIKASKKLFDSDAEYFASILPKTEHWMLYDFFKEDAVYLDIETDGLDQTADITVVGLFDGYETKTMIKGINLDFVALGEELKKYKMIVTFNGTVFDLPFIKKRYPKVLPDVLQFDLRFACSRIGLRGGLKEIEKKLGIRRNKIIEKIYGGDALLLWRMYRGSGDEHYLKLLVEYNEDDTINLKKIAIHTYDELKKLSE